MAGRLEKRLQPGERVLFRTGWSWKWPRRVALWSAGAGDLIGVIWATVILWIDPAFARPITFVATSTLLCAAYGPLLISCMSLFFFLSMGATAIATDMRLLYRSGPLSRRVVEIPLWHIQRLDQLSPVTVRDRSGKCTDFAGFYDWHGLAAAIRGLTGVPGPVLLEGRTRAWAAYGRTFQFVLAMASMSAALIPLLAYSGISEPATDLSADGASAYARWIDLATIILTVTAGAVPAMVAGFSAGPLLLTLAMRAALPAGEARQVLRACEDHWCGDSTDRSSTDSRLDKASRWPFIAARSLASRLYGERI